MPDGRCQPVEPSEALAANLAMELGPREITVNAVAPGGTRTDMASENYSDSDMDIKGMTALGRLADPREIAAAVAFLVSPDASYITGSSLRVDGGLIRRRTAPRPHPGARTTVHDLPTWAAGRP